jgi:hypothetical protein
MTPSQRQQALETFKKRYPHYPEVFRDDQILSHDVFKTFYSGWELATEAALERAAKLTVDQEHRFFTPANAYELADGIRALSKGEPT